jgi:membrane fusion protein, multidrug efflux system
MVKKVVLVVIALAFVALLAMRLMQTWQAEEVAGAGPGAMRRPAVLVETVRAENYRFEETINLMGELRPQARVEIGPKISGRLLQVLAEQGDPVRQGQLLAVIDDQELQQQLGRARAAIAVSDANLKQEEVNLENTRAQLARFEQLYEAQLVPLQNLEDLRTRVRSAEAQLEVIQAQIAQGRAGVRELEIQLEQTRLVSPLSGFVGERYLDPGALVSPNSPVLSVLDLSRMKTVVAAPEQYLRSLRPGLAGRVSVDAFPAEQFQGTIARIAPALDPNTRTAEVEIVIPNTQARLRAGMFARVSVIIGAQEALSIPRHSLVTRNERVGVFLLDDDTARFVDVQVGGSQEGRVRVINGIEAGQELVGQGAQLLNEGDAIRRREEGQPRRAQR